jgi:hypothetical protein
MAPTVAARVMLLSPKGERSMKQGIEDEGVALAYLSSQNVSKRTQS